MSGLQPVSDSQNAFSEQVDGWGFRLATIIYLQIDRSVSADEFLMVIHIRETASPKRTGLSHLVGQVGLKDPKLCKFLQEKRDIKPTSTLDIFFEECTNRDARGTQHKQRKLSYAFLKTSEYAKSAGVPPVCTKTTGFDVEK